MSVIVGEDDHSTTRRRNGYVINGGNAQVPTIRQMDGEQHKRHRVNQLSNACNHRMRTTLLRDWKQIKWGVLERNELRHAGPTT